MEVTSSVEIELRERGVEVCGMRISLSEGSLLEGSSIRVDGLEVGGGKLYFEWVLEDRKGELRWISYLDGFEGDYDFEIRDYLKEEVSEDTSISRRERRLYSLEQGVKEEVVKEALKMPHEGAEKWAKSLKEKALAKGELIEVVKEYRLVDYSKDLWVEADTNGRLVITPARTHSESERIETQGGEKIAELLEEVLNSNGDLQEVIKVIEQKRRNGGRRRGV